MSVEDAVVLLTSTEPTQNKNFGSAFIVARDDRHSYLLTCAHVLEQINGKGDNKLKVSGLDASVEVVCCGAGDSIDMALLKVEGLLDKPLLDQFMFGQEQAEIQITGYSLFDARMGQHIKRALNGNLGKKNRLTANNREYPFWDVAIRDDSFATLEGGYSGSPLYSRTGQVLGVVSHRRSGEYGHAFCISNLRTLYPAIDQLQPNFAQLTALPSLSSIRTRLLGRSKEIAKVFLKLRERLNRMEKDGVDDEGAFILQMCEEFLNRNMEAAEFIEICFPTETASTPNVQQPNYTLLAQRLRDGEIALCIGAELPKLFDESLNSVEDLPQRIAALTHFANQDTRSLAEVCEYAELDTNYARHSVLSELKKRVTQAHNPNIALHELLLKLDKPFLVISTGFDTLLEQRLSLSHRRFVTIVTNTTAESESQRYTLKYSDKDSAQCSDEQLSTLQLMENGYSVIFHPRGYHEDGQDTVLLSERDYFNASELLKKRYPAYLHNKLKNKGLWFLGFQPDSWETRLIAKALQFQRGANRDLPLVIQANADNFARLFWREMQCLHYPDLTAPEFVEKIGELV
ncbi:MAG: SIR2 family protein [Gallionella sp.]|nr:SIR2 family protein [Gallionella sp.]